MSACAGAGNGLLRAADVEPGSMLQIVSHHDWNCNWLQYCN
jgi:hypothetical protein